jgi:hypothetical protein
MSEAAVPANMLCPRCGHFQVRAAVCAACQVVVAKVRAPRTPQPARLQLVAARPARRVAGALTRLLHVVLGAALVGSSAALYLVVTPMPLTVAELAAGSGAAYPLREFTVEARVAGHHDPGLLPIATRDGYRLHALELAGGGATAHVSYDPRVVGGEPAVGVRVRVRGAFARVPHFDRKHGLQRSGIPVAASITPL